MSVQTTPGHVSHGVLPSSRYQPKPRRRPFWKDIGIEAVTVGAIANISYLFGAVPLLLGVLGTMYLTDTQVSSWFFIVFVTSGVASLVLSLHYRQPVAIGWSPAALVLIGSAALHYPLAEIAGATLIAGVGILLMGALGIARWLMRWVPLPLVLAMFAGSTFHYATAIFAQFGVQPLVVGATLIGYLFARRCSCRWAPPIGGAVVMGLLATIVSGEMGSDTVSWSAPAVSPVLPEFSLHSTFALALPFIALSIGTGNIQGLGLLVSNGYRPPVNVITSVIGASSIINALFGGHVASIQSNSGALLVGDDAGPRERRYAGVLIASVGCLVIAAGATVASGMLGLLPVSLIVSLAGLAILRTLMDAVEKAMTTSLRQSAFFTFVIAASPVTILGIGPALWAIVGGYLVALTTERSALVECLDHQAPAAPLPTQAG